MSTIDTTDLASGLAQVRALREAATPGPWAWIGDTPIALYSVPMADVKHAILAPDDRCIAKVNRAGQYVPLGATSPDAQWIIAGHAMADLLDAYAARLAEVEAERDAALSRIAALEQPGELHSVHKLRAALNEAREERDALQRRWREPGPEAGGWCGEHPQRLEMDTVRHLLNGDDGDLCLVCEVDRLAAELAEARRNIEDMGANYNRLAVVNAGLQGKVQRARAGLARQPVACCPNIECMEPVSDASRSTCAFCGAALARQEDPHDP